MVVAMTVRKILSELPLAARTVVVAMTAITAAAASWRLPTTPRRPAVQATRASVTDPATRYSPIPSPRY